MSLSNLRVIKMMSLLKTIWGLLFRLFPCPAPTGLREIGHPGPQSPVLVTCNFDLTIKRLKKALEGLDVWLLVAQSGGVNVWCAAGGDEFNTHSVVSAIKTSGIGRKVTHRTIILPPLSGPGVSIAAVRKATKWNARWGPVRAEDIRRYIKTGFRRDEGMRRVTYTLTERLDTALGSLFPFYLLGGALFALFDPSLLVNYLLVATAAFLFFFLALDSIPGERGIVKAGYVALALLVTLAITEFYHPNGSPYRSSLIIAVVMIFVYGSELGGLAPHLPSDLDPFLARLGVGAVGNVAFAGTVRTELLNGYRELTYDHEICEGCRNCFEICPQGVWRMGEDSKRAILADRDKCTACRACLLQCQSGAIQAKKRDRNEPAGNSYIYL